MALQVILFQRKLITFRYYLLRFPLLSTISEIILEIDPPFKYSYSFESKCSKGDDITSGCSNMCFNHFSANSSSLVSYTSISMCLIYMRK